MPCCCVALAGAIVDLFRRYRHGDPSPARRHAGWSPRRCASSWPPSRSSFSATDSEAIWFIWLASFGLPVLAMASPSPAITCTTSTGSSAGRSLCRGVGRAVGGRRIFVLVLQRSSAGPPAGPGTELDPLVVAASTLVVAALFNPIRTRVQALVDRRFHRSHYDAERTVAGFAGRLRDQLDLPTLTGELRRTTVRAVEPATTDVWLRRAT